MRAVLEDFSEPALLSAMEMNVHEAWIRFAHGLGAIVYDEADLCWFFSGLPFHLANGIVKAQFAADQLENRLDERLQELTTEGVPMACLMISQWQLRYCIWVEVWRVFIMLPRCRRSGVVVLEAP